VLKGRNWSTEAYRYGFNGKEKDDEFSVEDGSYDFGARMYDARLGRWWSVDKHFANQANWSTYKAMMNNPVVYTDPDGNTEFLTVTFVDKSGNVLLKKSVVYTEKVMTDGQKYYTDIYLFGKKWGVNCNYRYFDYESNFTFVIDENGKIIDSKEEVNILYGNGIKDEDTVFTVGEQDKWGDTKDPDGFNKEFDEQDSGFQLTGGLFGGGSSTNTKANEGSETVDIEDVLTALSTFGKDPTSAPRLHEKIGYAEFTSLIKDLKETVEMPKEYSGSEPKDKNTKNVDTSTDSIYIDYTKVTVWPDGRVSHGYGQEKILPKDTVGGYVKGDKNKIIRK
jgi:RHS repeat-associated protein